MQQKFITNNIRYANTKLNKVKLLNIRHNIINDVDTNIYYTVHSLDISAFKLQCFNFKTIVSSVYDQIIILPVSFFILLHHYCNQRKT